MRESRDSSAENSAGSDRGHEASDESSTGDLPAGAGPEGDGIVDPVKAAYGGESDLYDVATWEVRSSLDRFAVAVTRALRRIRSRLLLATALALFLAQLVVAGALVIEQPVFGVLAALSVAPALFVALTLWYWDPTTREPVELLAATFLLSMLFAGFAGVVNSFLLPVFEVFGVAGIVLAFFLVVGPIEEVVKWLAIRVRAYDSAAFRTVVDGVVYGAIAGLGFAAIENFIYVVSIALETAPEGELVQYQYAAVTAATRAFVGPGHVIFSAWAGFYLGLAKFNPEDWGPIVVKGLLVAVFIHGSYNTLVTVLPLPAIASLGVPPGLAFVVAVVTFHAFWFGLLYRKVRQYRAYYETVERPVR